MKTKYMACSLCGQDLNLSPSAEDELSDLRDDLKLERQRSKVLVEALKQAYDVIAGGSYHNSPVVEVIKEAIKKYEEMGK